ncbi:hypothetical protein LWF15_29875 [Kineosporia rhizophila]|uniref:hypothetical protein n=1 Tax=Kineosporia TaxID=49184 RepID=UPI001E41941A|nr:MULTISPECIES: hypothetical protein [Kineosporia]MCE0539716.1 hypothetical protein [Kineosporia rhizophila]GLY16388.1 hypothetical protein Kisp01_34030 [Kineosporia sp. NBRC 101677]
MSFVLWHKVEFAAVEAGGGGLLAAVASYAGLGLPLTVTNDVFGGGLVLDVAVRVTMGETNSATFEVTLDDLPEKSIALLKSVPKGGLRATVRLGYFDRPLSRATVMTGRVSDLTIGQGTGGVSQVVLTGQDEAGFKLLRRPGSLDRPSALPRMHMVRDLLQEAEVELGAGSTVPGTLNDFTSCARTTLGAVQDLAREAKVSMVVRDGAVYLGAAVGKEPAPVSADAQANVVARVDRQGQDLLPGELVADPPVRDQLEITVLGHPGLRAGQKLEVKNLDSVPAGPLRIARAVHEYGSDGYVTKLLVVAAPAGEPVRMSGGVQGVVDRLEDIASRGREDHPGVDVGEVTTYRAGKDGKHLGDLHYGQKVASGVVAPSVASPVTDDVELHNKPIASPFAFHQVGLVTPVYPGMRALLAHNRGLVNDAVVAGWLWPEKPRHAPPKNEPGDYWLALPTEIGDQGLPVGKGVNDLTDKQGARIIQARSLRIVVGTPALPPVGERPSPPPENTVVIEHHSGTTIEITSDGELKITTAQKKMTLTNGQVSLSLDGAKVAVQ